MATSKILKTTEACDDGILEREEKYVVVADEFHDAALDAALELRAISIRLPKQLIEQYKLIGHFHGVGYQPLMRDVLLRFVPSALKEILEAEQAKAIRSSDQAVLAQPSRKAA